MHFCGAVLFFKHDRERNPTPNPHRKTRTNRKRLDRPHAGRSNDCFTPCDEKDTRKNKRSPRRIILATERKKSENKNMKVTKLELINALIEARTALAKDIRDFNKSRNGFLGSHFRKSIREKIAAYRLLSSIDTIDAELYSFNARTRARVKKALAV